MSNDSKTGPGSGEKMFGIGSKGTSAKLTTEFLVFKGRAKVFDNTPAGPFGTFVFARRILRSLSLTPNEVAGSPVPNGGNLRVILEGHETGLTPVVVYEIDAAEYAELERVVNQMDR